MNCGRCGAELVVTLVNFFAKSNIIEEDSYNAEAWMTAAAFGLGSVLFAYFYLEHRHMHQSEKMANRLRTFANGNVLIKNGSLISRLELRVDSPADQAVIELAGQCVELWEAVSGAHSLKGDAVALAVQFDKDIQMFCTSPVSDQHPEQALVNYLQTRLTALHEKLVGLSNYLMVTAAIDVSTSSACCRRRESAAILFASADRVMLSPRGDRAGLSSPDGHASARGGLLP